MPRRLSVKTAGARHSQQPGGTACVKPKRLARRARPDLLAGVVAPVAVTGVVAPDVETRAAREVRTVDAVQPRQRLPQLPLFRGNLRGARIVCISTSGPARKPPAIVGR